MFDCPNLAVPMSVMQHVIRVESSHNPFAIGVVGGRLARQPRTLAEAVATANMLEQRGYNFSLGISQVNRYNLAKYGLPNYQVAFEICPNLAAGTRILRECYDRARDWGKAFSCYYSGNFTTGYKQGYVQKIFASMRQNTTNQALGSSVAIDVVDTRRSVVRVSRSSQYSTAATQASYQPQTLVSRVEVPQMPGNRYLQDPKPMGATGASIERNEGAANAAPVVLPRTAPVKASDGAFVF